MQIALEALREIERILREGPTRPVEKAHAVAFAAITSIEAATQPSEGEVERVARDIQSAALEHFDAPDFGEVDWCEIARAAIASMKGEG
jgi:hypothetical protein